MSFVAPWLLTALIGLPALWWLLRVTPPAPVQVVFPPIRILMRILSREESAARSPLWLILLRLAMIIAIILGASHPLWNATASLEGRGPLVLAVNDGWASSVDWPARQARLVSLVEQAGRENRKVLLLTTAQPETQGKPAPLQLLLPADARKAVAGLQPKPWQVDLKIAQQRLEAFDRASIENLGHVFVLSDGLARPGMAAFLESLRPYGRVTVVTDSLTQRAMILRQPLAKGDVLAVEAVRPHEQGTDMRWLRAVGEDGRLLARESFVFSPSKRIAALDLKLPTELRNKLSRLEIEGHGTAGSVVLLDERWRRRPVGLIDHAGIISKQPLLNELYYLERALSPFTEVRKGTMSALLERELAVLILTDSGGLQAGEKEKVEKWIERGGIMVRFAGPQLAEKPDGLLPVKLRVGDRVLGGTMSWSKPAKLKEFDDKSPFFGLDVPSDVLVKRQVLAQPSLDLDKKTWARLSDGTPLVTAEIADKAGWFSFTPRPITHGRICRFPVCS
ncbi:MAG: BatA domain-containing protein [Rhodospirillales bacterium]